MPTSCSTAWSSKGWTCQVWRTQPGTCRGRSAGSSRRPSAAAARGCLAGGSARRPAGMRLQQQPSQRRSPACSSWCASRAVKHRKFEVPTSRLQSTCCAVDRPAAGCFQNDAARFYCWLSVSCVPGAFARTPPSGIELCPGHCHHFIPECLQRPPAQSMTVQSMTVLINDGDVCLYRSIKACAPGSGCQILLCCCETGRSAVRSGGEGPGERYLGVSGVFFGLSLQTYYTAVGAFDLSPGPSRQWRRLTNTEPGCRVGLLADKAHW